MTDEYRPVTNRRDLLATCDFVAVEVATNHYDGMTGYRKITINGVPVMDESKDAEQSAADRIANAPRAWVAMHKAKVAAWDFLTKECAERWCRDSEATAARVALVELKEGE
jgi:hypothetical protein